MKITLHKRILRAALISGLAVLGGSLTSHLRAQVDPSVLGPDWDLTLSGQARGVAQITFNANGSLSGQVLIETRKTVGSSTSNVDERGSFPPDVRNGGTGSTNSTSSVTNISGLFIIGGSWGFDPSTQRIIGFLNEGANVRFESSTNATTNSVTFHGVVHGGTRPRMTLSGTSPLGRQVFHGVPLQALPDISGPYAAVGRRGEHSVVEFFTLSATGGNNYSVAGSSPGYTYAGGAILSARRQLSIATVANGTNGINDTIIVGGFNTNFLNTSRSLGTLKGSDNHGPVSFRIFDQ